MPDPAPAPASLDLAVDVGKPTSPGELEPPDGEFTPESASEPLKPEPEPPAPAGKPPAAGKPEAANLKAPAIPKADWVPKRADDWAKVKAERDEAVAARVRAEEALKARIDPEEVKRLSAERDELQGIVSQYFAERDPALNKLFDSRIKAATLRAVQAAPEDKRVELEHLLQMPPGSYRDGQIEGIISDLSPLASTRVTRAVSELESVIQERSLRAEQSRQNWDQLQRGQQAAAEKAQGEMARAFEETAAKWTDPEGPMELLKKQEGNDEFNKGVDEALGRMREVLAWNELPDAAKAHVAMSYATLPNALAALQVQTSEVERLKGELKKLQAAQPGGETLHNAPGIEPTSEEETGEYGDAILRAARQAGLQGF